MQYLTFHWQSSRIELNYSLQQGKVQYVELIVLSANILPCQFDILHHSWHVDRHILHLHHKCNTKRVNICSSCGIRQFCTLSLPHLDFCGFAVQLGQQVTEDSRHFCTLSCRIRQGSKRIPVSACFGGFTISTVIRYDYIVDL